MVFIAINFVTCIHACTFSGLLLMRQLITYNLWFFKHVHVTSTCFWYSQKKVLLIGLRKQRICFPLESIHWTELLPVGKNVLIFLWCFIFTYALICTSRDSAGLQANNSAQHFCSIFLRIWVLQFSAVYFNLMNCARQVSCLLVSLKL